MISLPKNKSVIIWVLVILLALLSIYAIGGNRKYKQYQNQINKFALKRTSLFRRNR